MPSQLKIWLQNKKLRISYCFTSICVGQISICNMKRAPSFNNLPTPIPIIRTSCGSLCYTTVDLQATINGSYLLQTDIADSVGKSFGSTSLNSLFKRSSSADILSARHIDSVLVSGATSVWVSVCCFFLTLIFFFLYCAFSGAALRME